MSQIPLNYFSSLAPSGTVVAFAGTTAPSGWLLCSGTAVSRTTYAALFSAIGTAHGYGDNSTTFNLPNYQGRFLRGRANGSSNDPDRASRTAMATGGATGDNVGSVQLDEFESHQHEQPYLGSAQAGADNGGAPLSADTNYNTGRRESPVSATGGNETRPKNANVNYIIKI